ncbi:MAG: hypothetical protein K2J99_03025 [Lachnospiraceae bacterium]|nr:hypothetical protein [Lachnospiraceae bacterium]
MIHRITFRQVVDGLLIAVVGIILLVMLCWKPLVTWQIESVNLPEGCVTVHPARVELSDVCWLHIQGEKVLACEQGFESAQEYIESHNSALRLWNISVLGWGAMSDMFLLDSEYDTDFNDNWDRDEYVKITYSLRLQW